MFYKLTAPAAPASARLRQIRVSPYELRRRFANIFIKVPEKRIGQRFASYLLLVLLHFQFTKLIQKVKSQQVL
jgi:hypothetical protein